MDAAHEMLRRYDEKAAVQDDSPSPQIILDTDKTDFYDFTADDFRIEDYVAVQPQLKLDLGI